MVWVAFGVGLFLGCFAGMLAVGFCQAAAKFDRDMEKSLAGKECND